MKGAVMGPGKGNVRVKAVVVRANGAIEDLGVIAQTRPPTLKERVSHFLRRLI